MHHHGLVKLLPYHHGLVKLLPLYHVTVSPCKPYIHPQHTPRTPPARPLTPPHTLSQPLPTSHTPSVLLGGLFFDVVKLNGNVTTTPCIGISQSIRGKGKSLVPKNTSLVSALVPKNTSLVAYGHSWGIFGTCAGTCEALLARVTYPLPLMLW